MSVVSEQDWKPVVFNKSKSNGNRKSSSVLLPVHRTASAARFQKLDDPDAEPVKKIPLSISSKIRNARNEKGMTQKDLAQRAGVKQEVIQSYENGRAIPNGQLLSKIRRILSIS